MDTPIKEPWEKVLATALAVLVAAFILYRITASFIFSTTPRHIWNRNTGGLYSLITIMEKIENSDLCGPLVVVAGSSVSRELQLDVAPYKFINVALVGGSPLIVDFLQRKLEDRLKSCPPAERIVFLEFMPSHLTNASRESYVMKDRLKFSYMLDYGQIFNRFSDAPDEALDILMMKLKGSTHSEVLTSILSHIWFQSELKSMTMEENAEFYKKASDIEDLKFSEKNIDVYLQTLKKYQKFSSKLFLHLPPENSGHLRYTVEGEKRMKALEERIKLNSGEDVFHLSRMHDFKTSDFRDAIHLETNVTLNQTSRLLSEVFRSYLKSQSELKVNK